jgi:hypothetical protein
LCTTLEKPEIEQAALGDSAASGIATLKRIAERFRLLSAVRSGHGRLSLCLSWSRR